MSLKVFRAVWLPLVLLANAGISLGAEGRSNDYAVVLSEPPLAVKAANREALRGTLANSLAIPIRKEQELLGFELRSRNIAPLGFSQLLLNAAFISASPDQAQALSKLPYVRYVVLVPPMKPHLDRALDLIRASGAWTAAGGMGNAGAGMKIGVIDSGIDNTHAAFQDDSLPIPAGFPKGRAEDLPYTNRKIIVARSYVSQLPYAEVKPEDSRPDDTTPRDRLGHGTAVAMIAAGVRNTGRVATITGVAPKAYLGNYKIIGSPGINDTTRFHVLVQALEDALSDGMDIVTLSIGSPAVYGPMDRATYCYDSQLGSNACDIRAEAVENAVKKGLTVVVSAGNDGDLGLQFPTLNSIHSPGTAPSAITVGASTNSHVFFQSVRAGADRFNGLFGNGPRPNLPLVAPLKDVSRLQDDGKACSPLTLGSLAGAIALVQRGNCAFSEKVINAQKAGAVGVIIYQIDGSEFVFPPGALSETGIPAVLIGNQDGTALKNRLGQGSDVSATLDPAWIALGAEFDTVAYFSSQGPSIGESGIKPELVAVGTDLYAATQKLEPNGELYDPTGYTMAQGTSFAVPLVAGAAALVKQKNPSFTPAQIKSALVNTATDEILDGSGRAPVAAVGAGKLNAQASINPGATVEPATLSFGIIAQSSLPVSKALKVTNVGSAAATFTAELSELTTDRNAKLTVSPSSLQLNPGATGTLTIRLEGARPAPGSYQGFLLLRGVANLRVPVSYLVGDGIPFNIFPLRGSGFVGLLNEPYWLMAFKLVDRYGVPVENATVRFSSTLGGGTLDTKQGVDGATDRLGIAGAWVILGPRLGAQQFTAEVGGLTLAFDGTTRLQPTIKTGGVVNAASFQAGNGLAPGSYATIQGAALSESLRAAATSSLPLSLAGVSVSFDSTAAKLSLPGRLHFVSENQINVQIPWEFQGLTKALVKVSVGEIPSAVYEVPLADYSPAPFEYSDPDSGRRLVAALDLGYQLITVANAAQRGRTVQLYANGLGPVDRPQQSGEPAPGDSLVRTRVTPIVTIGGVQAQVGYSGLAPGLVGLYQINVTVPENAPTGLQPVIITVNGIESKSATIPVR